MNPVPGPPVAPSRPVSVSCEKCNAELPADQLALSCRVCGRRWHKECGAGVKLCLRCSSPVRPETAPAPTARTTERIKQRDIAWKMSRSFCKGGWVLTFFSLRDGVMNLTAPEGKPLVLTPWWIVMVALLTAASAFLQIRFFRRQVIHHSVWAALSAMVVTVLIMVAALRDSPAMETRAVLLGILAFMFFGASMTSALRWDKMPKR